jgi:hypothetical protein
MNSLIKTIEAIGSSSSLKQHNSVKDMLESGHYNLDIIEETFKNSHELICMIEPEDDK